MNQLRIYHGGLWSKDKQTRKQEIQKKVKNISKPPQGEFTKFPPSLSIWITAIQEWSSLKTPQKHIWTHAISPVDNILIYPEIKSYIYIYPCEQLHLWYINVYIYSCTHVYEHLELWKICIFLEQLHKLVLQGSTVARYYFICKLQVS